MMNIDIFLLISFLLPFVMMGGLFYFIVGRKNNFEERVAHYIPYHSLDSERRQYIEKVEKYKRYICIGLKVFFSFSLILSVSLLLFAINSKQGSAPEIMPQRLLALISIPVAFTFLLHFQKTNKVFTASDAEKQVSQHLKVYEKTEKFFKKSNNDIYKQLKPYFQTAVSNATALGTFDPYNHSKAMCEMFLLFKTLQLL